MARRQAAALAGLGTNTLAALSPQVVALLLLSPAEFAVFSLLFVALGLVQSAQNSLVVDPWLRHDRESGRVPLAPVLWSSAALALIGACIPVALGFVDATELVLVVAGLMLAQARNSLRLMSIALSWRPALVSDSLFIVGLGGALAWPHDSLGWDRLWLALCVASLAGLVPWMRGRGRASRPTGSWQWFRERRSTIASLWLESSILDLGVAAPPIFFAKVMVPVDFAVVRATTSALLPVRLILLPLRAQIVGRPPHTLRRGRTFQLLLVLSALVGLATTAGLLLVGSWSVAQDGVLPLLRAYAAPVGLMGTFQLTSTALYIACRVHCSPRRLLVARLSDTAQQLALLGAGFFVAGLDGAVWGYAAFSAVSSLIWWQTLGEPASSEAHEA